MLKQPVIGVLSALLLSLFGLGLQWRAWRPRGPHAGTAYATLAIAWTLDCAFGFYALRMGADAVFGQSVIDSFRLTLRLAGLLMFCQMGHSFGVARGLCVAAAAGVALLLALLCAHVPTDMLAWQFGLAGALVLSCLTHAADWWLRRAKRRVVQHRLAWAGILAVGALLTVRSLEIYEARAAYGQIAIDIALVAVVVMLSLPRRRHAPRSAVDAAAPGRKTGMVEHALEQQRTRIAQDLHDGVGAHLLSIIARQPNNTSNERETVAALESCMLELRIAVDQLVDSHASLLNSLGMVRYRIQPALDRLGIRLAWQMDERENPAKLSPAHTREVLLILQEALSNVLRHSQASQVRVALDYSSRAGFVLLEVQDDGRGIQGFAPDESGGWVSTGRGLQNLRDRAARLGAELEMQSSAGAGTLIRLMLPL